jgi:predicted ATPase
MNVPVVLFMDDVQWIDEASNSLLERLLRQRHRNFFFFGCYRDDEMPSEHQFSKMLANIRSAGGINETTVKLHRLEEEPLNNVISDTLCLLPRLVRPLSAIIWSMTKGNLLFVTQLMISLIHDGLLHKDLCRKQWVWNEEEICATKLPDNVAVCFSNQINKLPADIQTALHTLSLLGNFAKIEWLELLEKSLNTSLVEPLIGAIGLVHNLKDGSLHFTHDRIQNTCYNLVTRTVRCCSHLALGKCFLAETTTCDELLFLAMCQINHAGPSVAADREECIVMAESNLTAGRRSMAVSDFATAHSLLQHGIGFLCYHENNWGDYYTLKLSLYDLASKCALATANIQDLTVLSSQIMANARCFDDTINISFIQMSLLAHSSKMAEALDLALAVLSKLGEDLPMNHSQDVLKKEVQKL